MCLTLQDEELVQRDLTLMLTFFDICVLLIAMIILVRNTEVVSYCHVHGDFIVMLALFIAGD